MEKPKYHCSANLCSNKKLQQISSKFCRPQITVVSIDIWQYWSLFTEATQDW